MSLHLVYASAACERYKNARRGGRRRGFAAASLNLNVRKDEMGGWLVGVEVRCSVGGAELGGGGRVGSEET